MSATVSAVPAPDLVAVHQKLRKLPPKGTVQQWMTIRPGRAYRDIALSWVAVVAALAGAAALGTWWAFAAAFVVVGLAQYALVIIGHDGIHWALHPRKAANDRISRWLIHGPLFMALDDGRRNHLEHHKLLGTEDDPDRYLHSLENKNSRLRLALFCLGVSTFFKTVLKVTPFGKLLAEPRARSDRGPAKKAPNAGLASVLGGYAAQRLPVAVTQPLMIAFVLAVGLPWWAYPLLWVAPIYFCVFLPDEVRAFCDHAVPTVPDAEADPSRLVSFQPNALEAAVFSPHNMNLHAEHHLWPSVPYYNLPSVRSYLGDRPEVTIRRSYVAFLAGLFGRLPISPGRDPRHG
jgi:fatty acid desaturase